MWVKLIFSFYVGYVKVINDIILVVRKLVYMKIVKKIIVLMISVFMMVGGFLPKGIQEVKAVDYETSTLTFSDFRFHQSDARSMLNMINKFRAGSDAWQYDQNGKRVQIKNLKPLKYDYELEKIAMQRAAEIVLLFNHLRPNNTYVFDMLKSKGFNGGGENIAKGTATKMTTKFTFEDFQETNKPYSEQGHRRNMLGDFDTVGIACVEYAGLKHWVQVFGNGNANTIKPTPAIDKNKTMKVDVFDE